MIKGDDNTVKQTHAKWTSHYSNKNERTWSSGHKFYTFALLELEFCKSDFHESSSVFFKFGCKVAIYK